MALDARDGIYYDSSCHGLFVPPIQRVLECRGQRTAALLQPHQRQALVQGTVIPEVGLAAPYTTMAGADGKRHSAVPLRDGAGIVCHRTAATHLVKAPAVARSEEHTSELQSLTNLVCRL